MQFIPADAGKIELTGELIEIPSGQSALPVMLYRPPESTPRPCLVVCPGGTGQGLFEIAEWLCSRARQAGYIALTLSWRDASPVHDPEDIAAALTWLRRQPFVDATRAMLFGGSRGANAALRGAALDDGVKAVVTLGALTDPLSLVVGAAAYAPSRYELLKGWLGDPVQNRRFYDEIAAISYADRIRCPTLMIHGTHDFHCPIEQSIVMCDKIRASGNNGVELLKLAFVGHYGDVVPNGYAFDYLFNEILKFLSSATGGI
jgi:dipeptidyl aminopeptidase/acylaminoacyl peptidase